MIMYTETSHHTGEAVHSETKKAKIKSRRSLGCQRQTKNETTITVSITHHYLHQKKGRDRSIHKTREL